MGSVVVENARRKRSETYQHRRDHRCPGVFDQEKCDRAPNRCRYDHQQPCSNQPCGRSAFFIKPCRQFRLPEDVRIAHGPRYFGAPLPSGDAAKSILATTGLACRILDRISPIPKPTKNIMMNPTITPTGWGLSLLLVQQFLIALIHFPISCAWETMK